MANLDKAHKRIEKLYQGELSGVSYNVRQALGRRLEVDARIRAIEHYLEELTFDLEQARGRCACGLPFAEHPAGISEACGPALSPGPAGSVIGNLAETTPVDVPSAPLVGRLDGPGEIDKAEIESLREQIRRHEGQLEHMRACVLADRQRVGDVVLAARLFSEPFEHKETENAARAKLVAALAEYDDYIPF
jgi:hypothetical protein